MKLQAIICCCALLLGGKIGFAPSNSAAFQNYNTVLNDRFEGGAEAFKKFFYSNITYPFLSRNNCEIGQLYVRITVSPEGGTPEIELMNNLSGNLDQEVMRVLRKSAKHWIVRQYQSMFVISVGFQLENKPVIKGDLKVSAHAISGGNGNCSSNRTVEHKMHQSIDRRKFKKARRHCEELLRRDPTNPFYKKVFKSLNEELNAD
ncbi:MAG: hypothetical protein AAF990_01735 [Bacteroidota bacterium]